MEMGDCWVLTFGIGNAFWVQIIIKNQASDVLKLGHIFGNNYKQRLKLKPFVKKRFKFGHNFKFGYSFRNRG